MFLEYIASAGISGASDSFHDIVKATPVVCCLYIYTCTMYSSLLVIQYTYMYTCTVVAAGHGLGDSFDVLHHGIWATTLVLVVVLRIRIECCCL